MICLRRMMFLYLDVQDLWEFDRKIRDFVSFASFGKGFNAFLYTAY